MQIFEEGWIAGRRGDDPRTCPYQPMTVEAREWLSFHRLGVFYETADKPATLRSSAPSREENP